MSTHSASATILSLFLSHALLRKLDEDGRPLGEQAIEDAYKKAGVDERTCPYPDRRRLTGKPINAAALRQVSHCWGDVCSQFQRLAWHHVHHTKREMLTGHEMWRVHLLALAGPALFKIEHPTQPIPRLLSAMFKTSLGYATILPSLLLSQPGASEIELVSTLPANDFFTLSDEQGWLIGQKQVCAGSASWIKQSYEAMGRISVHSAQGHEIFERSDLTSLSADLAHTWANLLHCAVWTRDLLAQGTGVDLAEYLDASPSQTAQATWPVCVQLFKHPNAPRHFALPRAMPGLTPAHISALFTPSSPFHSPPNPHSLIDIDTLMLDICHNLSTTLSLPPLSNHQLSTCYDVHTQR